MTSRRRPRSPLEIVTLATQDERDRLAMVMMQLDMALALAREQNLIEIESYLETALAEARLARNVSLN